MTIRMISYLISVCITLIVIIVIIDYTVLSDSHLIDQFVIEVFCCSVQFFLQGLSALICGILDALWQSIKIFTVAIALNITDHVVI